MSLALMRYPWINWHLITFPVRDNPVIPAHARSNPGKSLWLFANCLTLRPCPNDSIFYPILLSTFWLEIKPSREWFDFHSIFHSLVVRATLQAKACQILISAIQNDMPLLMLSLDLLNKVAHRLDFYMIFVEEKGGWKIGSFARSFMSELFHYTLAYRQYLPDG